MDADRHKILTEVGRTVAVMHDGGLVHGDLTTSNMIVRAADAALVSAAHEAVCSCDSQDIQQRKVSSLNSGQVQN
jgi:tRNA A-37 threonylcarbamoyl transferase component Bud32